MSAFELAQSVENPAVMVITANERINMGNIDELSKLGEQAYSQGNRCLLLDLSATPSITSAGLRVIFSIFKKFGGKEAFKLVSPSEDVRRTLTIAGIAYSVEIFDDLSSAVASFH
jgi:anti-anti-sigma factor